MKYLIIGVVALATACTPTQQAVVSAVATAMNPAADAGDKTCAVLEWGIPIARSRMASYGPRAQAVVAYSEQIVSAGCRLNDATWRDRAAAAASELVNVLWALVRTDT